jgi:hypothetical protein
MSLVTLPQNDTSHRRLGGSWEPFGPATGGCWKVSGRDASFVEPSVR